LKRAIALLPMLCLVLACRAPLPGSALPDDDPRPAALMATQHQRAATRQALRATAKLDLQAPDVRLNRPQRMAVERPSRLRIEIIGLFSQLAAVLVTDGEIYQLYDARRGDIEEGVVSAGLLWRSPGAARVFEDGAIEVDQLNGEGRLRQRLRFDSAGRLTRLETFAPGGELLWRAGFADYRLLPGAGAEVPGEPGPQEPFAFDVQLDFPRVEAEVRLQFKKIVEPGVAARRRGWGRWIG
jgi:hypothetical protein